MLELSKDALSFKELLRKAGADSPEDISKIEAIKNQIKDGKYSIDSKKIADSMIKKARGIEYD